MSDSEDEIDGTETSFKAELVKIVEELTRTQSETDCCLLDEVKFLVAGVVGCAANERITTFYDLFAELEHRGAISMEDAGYLAEVLHIIHKDSLAERLRQCPWKRLRRGNSFTEFFHRRKYSGSYSLTPLHALLGVWLLLMILTSTYSVVAFFKTRVSSQKTASNMFFNVPAKYKQFYGQDVHLQKIEECVEKNDLCMLKGIQGRGKKSLMKTFVHDNRGKYPGGVFWLTNRADIITMAGYIATAEHEVLSIQSNQNYAYFESAIRYAWEYLSNQDEWLVIFVDVDSLSNTDFKEMQRLINELTPGMNGQRRHVLYSAQVLPKHLPTDVHVYEVVTGLTQENAHKYFSDAIKFSSTINETEKQELQNIWEVTGCHPYAISQAANFIREWNFTLEAFLDYWKHTSVEEWLAIFGYKPEHETLEKQLLLLDELKTKPSSGC
ncbi:uncharacterized protein [Ptychodera flava]|uniref:uncharacterized protein n=1 Tax=Ptychodera flava TaxID=63121 RepID=UPI00396A0362